MSGLPIIQYEKFINYRSCQLLHVKNWYITDYYINEIIQTPLSSRTCIAENDYMILVIYKRLFVVNKIKVIKRRNEIGINSILFHGKTLRRLKTV